MIRVLGSERLSLVEVEAFLAASESVGFAGEGRAAIYRWCEALLCHHEYGTQKRRARGLIRAYMERMTGLSRAQCTRLIARYRKSGGTAVRRGKCPTFARRYTAADVALLARVDEAHDWLSGPATRAILKREFEVYGNAEFCSRAGRDEAKTKASAASRSPLHRMSRLFNASTRAAYARVCCLNISTIRHSSAFVIRFIPFALRYHVCMKADPAISQQQPEFVTGGNVARPLSLHPFKTGAAVAALLKVRPPVKPGK